MHHIVAATTDKPALPRQPHDSLTRSITHYRSLSAQQLTTPGEVACSLYVYRLTAEGWSSQRDGSDAMTTLSVRLFRRSL